MLMLEVVLANIIKILPLDAPQDKSRGNDFEIR